MGHIILFSLNAYQDIVPYLKELERIDKQNFGKEHWNEAAFTAEFPNKWNLSILAISGPKLVGYLFGSSYEMNNQLCTHVNRISVDRFHPSKGVGTLLINEFESKCRKINAQAISLEFGSNLTMTDFYKRFGFQSIEDFEQILTYLRSKKKLNKSDSFIQFSTHLMLKTLK